MYKYFLETFDFLESSTVIWISSDAGTEVDNSISGNTVFAIKN